MERYLCWGVLCLLGIGLLQINAFEVEIKNGTNETCIFARMNVSFTIQYETINNTSNNVTFVAPDKVTTEGSNCDFNLLNVHFGNNHSWSLNFTKNGTLYRGDVLTFTYNTNDTELFPDAKRLGLLTSVTRESFFTPVPLNAFYKCVHDDVITTDNVVQLYWNVTLQAYVQNSTLGNESRCSADTPTTPVPTTPVPTTPNVTMPSTTATPPKPTPKPVDKPTTGNYSVSNTTAVCLLVSIGVQFNASMLEDKNVWTVINLNPNSTSSGSCGNDSALLILNDGNTTIVEFHFYLVNGKFHLQEVNVTLTNGSVFFRRSNVNMTLWEAPLGSSYLCRKEQLINVSEDLSINTFDVRVQPFGVGKGGTFDTAFECRLDDDSILIPIIVGAALSAEDCLSVENFTVPIVVGAALGGLVIIVMVVYFIGRRNRRTAGYENFQ
ncbi:lysosome-associated membrane glycoprotein 2 [Gastrophryne carolinensis]